jgi:DNA-binding Xre family transcriptional regulator
MPSRVRWNIAPLLEREGISGYTLAAQADLHRATIYEDLMHGKARGVKFDTLERVLDALEVLLERRVTLEEILEVQWEE